MAKQYVSGYPGLLGICVVEVQSGNRVDIPARLVRAVPWLKGKPGTKIEALAMVGSAGGIQLDAPGGMLTRRVDKIVELLRTADTVEGDDVTSSTAIAARLAAASWKVSIRRLEPTEVALYAHGNILEIWRPDDLASLLRNLAGRRAKLLDQAIEALEEARK